MSAFSLGRYPHASANQLGYELSLCSDVHKGKISCSKIQDIETPNFVIASTRQQENMILYRKRLADLCRS